MTHKFRFDGLAWVVLALCIAALYGQFLWNPLIFDDTPFFIADADGLQTIDAFRFSWVGPRSLPHLSLAWTKASFGMELLPFRVGNLALHVGVALAVYALLKILVAKAYGHQDFALQLPGQLALIATLVFAVHPLSTYAVGYLVQRTILFATLFGVLSIWCWSKGLQSSKAHWAWCGVVMYYLAVFSKEQAITLIAIVPLLAYYLDEDWRAHWRRFVAPALAMTAIAGLIFWAKRNVMGSGYEPEANHMLAAVDASSPYASSVITQCWLFFKYLGLWLAPRPEWQSIDMREPFVAQIVSTKLVGLVGFVAWGGVGAWLLKRRGMQGLAGLGMLFPWIMFLTELSTVRIQEPFVLYRSYLWMAGTIALIPVAIHRMDKKMMALIFVPVIATLFILSMERLATFSSPILVWEDAKKLVEDRPDARGAERIYYNLGRQQMLEDMVSSAEKNLRKALEIAPNFVEAHGVLGALYVKTQRWSLAIDEYTQSMQLETTLNVPHQSVYLVGRAQAYEGAGEGQRAIADYLEACRINPKVCDSFRRSALQHR